MPSAPRLTWKSEAGLETIQTIVKRCTAWTDGLYAWQLPLIALTLDGDDYLCITATGDGKSALFAIPIIVLLEYNRNPELYHTGLKSRSDPISVVITPTKGLANSFVYQLKRDFGLDVLAYSAETVGHAKRNEIDLVSKVIGCKDWHIILLDPEHLTGQDWRRITDAESFLKNLVAGTVDEAHLIKEWGRDFRVAYRLIGKFMRGRFPSHTSISGLTATLLPGPSTTDVCNSLGLYRDRFTLTRRSNERSNMQLTIISASKALSGTSFPDLLPYLNQHRKTVISCQSLEIVHRVFMYLLRCLGHSSEGFSLIRPYHALLPASFNQETIQLMETDSRFMVIVSTVALSLGINAKTVVDNIGLDMPTTVEGWVQEKGRAGRDRSQLARGITLISKNTITAAKKAVSNPVISPETTVSSSKIGPRRRNNAGGMDLHRAEMIVAASDPDRCLNAQQNIIFQNPPIKTSQLDCIAAKRLVYCANCTKRAGMSYAFPPSPQPPDSLPLPEFRAPAEASKKKKLSKKNSTLLREQLTAFGTRVRDAESDKSFYSHLPDYCHFTTGFINKLVENFITIKSQSELQQYTRSWIHEDTYSSELLELLLNFHSTLKTAGKRKRRAKQARDQSSDIDVDDEEVDAELLDPSAVVENGTVGADPVPEPLASLDMNQPKRIPRGTAKKREAAQSSTAPQPKRRRQQETVAEVMSSYSRPFKPRERRARN